MLLVMAYVSGIVAAYLNWEWGQARTNTFCVLLQAYLRKEDQPYGPLKPHEIKRHTVQQLARVSSTVG